MHVRFHILPASAAPGATLFALRHNAGHLLRDGDGKVILCPDVETAERERRRNSASAPVSYVVALVPESDVREVDAMERLAEALAKRLGPDAAPTGGDVQSDDSAAFRAAEQLVSTMKIGAEERPIVENTAGQWSDTPGAAEIPPVALTVDPRVQEALSGKAKRSSKGRLQ